MNKQILLLLATSAATVFTYEGILGYEPDLMTQLPDCEPFNYLAYSGYLTVNANKSLHYVFVQSQSNPQTDPVLLWFNGGPGCSSLLGFFQEHGPWIMDDGEDFIKENEWPWNLRANVVYIESPAGVGYTKYNSKLDTQFDDETQSEDLYVALTEFYKKFPNFLNHELYISGESYAGIYVPYLAWQIDQHNALAATDSSITVMNLKGFLVGNGCTDFTIDGNNAMVPTLYGFHIIPEDLYNQYMDNNCNFTIRGCIPVDNPAVCDAAMVKIEKMISGLNIYDFFRPVYSSNSLKEERRLSVEDRYEETIVNGEIKRYKRGHTASERTPWLKDHNKILLGDALTSYVNREDVRAAMNIPTEIQAWEDCSNILYTVLPQGSYWIYQQLRGKYRILVYSGDTDGAVPTYGTKVWIDKLNWPILQKWRNWYTNNQVSGQIERHDGLDWVTVHGVGHMCPQWKRQDVTTMILNWIHQETF